MTAPTAPYVAPLPSLDDTYDENDGKYRFKAAAWPYGGAVVGHDGCQSTMHHLQSLP